MLYMNLKSFAIAEYVLLFLFIDLAFGTLYKAGVVEYFNDVNDASDPQEALEDNLNEFVKITEEFKQSWHNNIEDGILVFPEIGLSQKISVPVPEPDYKNNIFNDKVIETLSKAAKTYKTWIVVNLIEACQDKKFNTDVVFRSNGTIAAKYRKYNLFGEKLDRPDTPDAVSFETDFEITFGIFTCFDILYARPALDLVKQGIKHFVYPTAWYSELPFLTAIQYQMSWAWSNDATVLASGLSNTKTGSTGSGIYRGKKGPLTYYQTFNSTRSELVIAILDTNDQESNQDPENTIIHIEKEKLQENSEERNTKGEVRSSFKLLQEDLTTFTTQPITHDNCKITGQMIPGKKADCIKEVNETICDRGLCCNFHVSAVFNIYICKDENCNEVSNYFPNVAAHEDFSLSMHRLAVFNGVRSFYVANAGLQTCGLIPCTNNDKSSCGLPPQVQTPICYLQNNHKICILRRYISNVKIEGNFEMKNSFTTPNILLGGSNVSSPEFGQLTNDFMFSQDISGRTTITYRTPRNDTPLSTIAIWNRVYDRDGEPLTTNASAFSTPSTFIIINTVICGFILHKVYLKFELLSYY